MLGNETMTDRTKRVFISDIHLGTNAPWDWYQRRKHEDRLLNLLGYVAAPQSGIKDLVLLGDVFETWACPIGDVPRPFADILAENHKVVDALANCVRGIPNVFFVRGNHDMHVTAEHLGEKLAGIKHIAQYNSGLLHAEHGSRFAMFNAIDQLHDPRGGLPLGYYITRILTGNDDYDKPGALIRYIDDLLEAAFTTTRIAESVIEALAEHALIDLDDPIAMPDGRRSTTLRHVQKRYAGLFDRWIEKFGYRYAINAVRAEGGGLGWFADRLCKKKDFRIVVLGHTHDSDLDRDGWFATSQTIYANSGYWCPKPGENAHFVEVDKRVGEFRVAVRTLDDSGKPTDVKSESITA